MQNTTIDPSRVKGWGVDADLSAVFGTSSPPMGLSGVIRRLAFKYSESSYGYWAPLILADRVGVVEGILGDVAHGHVPDILGELGIKAQWKYNRKAAITSVAAGAALAVLAAAYLRRRKRDTEVVKYLP